MFGCLADFSRIELPYFGCRQPVIIGGKSRGKKRAATSSYVTKTGKLVTPKSSI